MKLNLDIIRDHLPQNYQIQHLGPKDSGLSLSWPLLYAADMRIQSNRLYVSHIDALPQLPPPGTSAWILVGGDTPHQWIACNVEVLLIANVSSASEVYNAVYDIYAKFDAWDCRLRDELEADEDFSLNQIIETGSTMLENHIGVTDQCLQVIFSSEIIPQPDGRISVAVSEIPFRTPLSTDENVKNLCGIEGILTTPFISSLLWRGCRLYCNNLYPLGYYIGSVCLVERHRPFRESDFSLADHFFSYFQRAFLKHLRMVGQVDSPDVTALRSLLSGTPLSSEEREQLSLYPGESWICFKLKELRGKKYMPKDYMCATIRALMPKPACTVLIYNEAIVGLLRQTGAPETETSTFGLFQEILSRMDYTGGLSNEFTDLQKISDYLMQADYVVEACSQSDTSHPLHFFRDYVLQYMLHACTGSLALESLYSKDLLALLEYDRKRNTDYTKTLNTYLRNEMSITRTAEMLYIHRSSLLKRLDKIRQLVDADLDDPDVRLYFRLCFSLWEKGCGNNVYRTE